METPFVSGFSPWWWVANVANRFFFTISSGLTLKLNNLNDLVYPIACPDPQLMPPPAFCTKTAGWGPPVML